MRGWERAGLGRDQRGRDGKRGDKETEGYNETGRTRCEWGGGNQKTENKLMVHEKRSPNRTSFLFNMTKGKKL